jgi:PAS domain S-box-containing protein
MAAFDPTAFEALAALVIVLDPTAAIVYWNRATSELVGCPLEEARGQQLRTYLASAADSTICEDAIRDTAATRRSRRFEAAVTPPGGVRRTLVFSTSVVDADEGAGPLVVLNGIDVSDAGGGLPGESRRAPAPIQQALRLSEERLRVSLQASPAVVFNQDLQLRYTWIHNPKQPFIAEQVLGKTDFDLLPRADAEQLTILKRRVIETGAGVRTIVRTTIGPEALYYDLTVEPLRDEAGRMVGITCATWEVTDQHCAEENQRFLAAAGAGLLSASLNHEQMLDQLGQLAVRELADCFLADVVEGDRIRRLRVTHSDALTPELAAELAGLQFDRGRPHLMYEPLQLRRTKVVSDVSETELEALAQDDGQLRLLRALGVRSFLAVPLVSRGQLLGAFALVSCRDPRRYRARDLGFAEELARIVALAVENAQLHAAAQRAVAARDELLGIVAHDLRTPLNIVMMQSQLLRLHDREPERRSLAPIDTIHRAAQRMNRLVQDMLDIARLESGPLAIERDAVSTRELIDEAVQSHRDAASQAGLELRQSAPAHLPDALGDRDRLLQVLDNLIGNAIKFTPSGGAVEVGAEPGTGEVLFRVTDSGGGIPEEHLPHLFDRFWQAKRTDRRGAGLGLPIAKGIVEGHGGRIWVESQLGKGSTFYFTVPSPARQGT